MKDEDYAHAVEANKRIYDGAFAPIYDNYHFNSIPTHYSQRIYMGILETIAGKVRDDPLMLDIGCGTGSYSLDLLRRFPNGKLVANDISRSMLDIFRGKLTPRELEITEMVCSPVEDILSGGKHYDIISVEGALHHMPDYLKIIEMSARSLSPGGYLLIFNEPRQTTLRFGKALKFGEAVFTRLMVMDYASWKRYLPFRLLSEWYAARFPQIFAVLKRRTAGYPFTLEERADYEDSEHQKGGLDVKAITKILNREGMILESLEPAPDYDYYWLYAISRVAGGNSFILLARK